jgi:MFS family permease
LAENEINELGQSTVPAAAGKRNFLLLVLDGILFFAALAFIEPGTVLPAFVSRLTDSGVIIGLVTVVRNGGWLLPQLVAANYIEQQPRKRPIMLRYGFVSRLALIVLAVIVYSGRLSNPPAILTLFFFLFLTFNFCEGISTVVWVDIIAATIPASRRGALFSAMHFFGNLLGLGAGLVARSVLNNPGISFPRNFGLLFCLAAAVYCVEYIFLVLLWEVPATAALPKRTLSDYFRSMPRLFRANPHFSRLAIIRVLVGCSGMLVPFYVVHGQRLLQLEPGFIGSFIFLQTAGSSLGSAVFGRLSDRCGNRSVILSTAGAALLAPLFALAALHADGVIPAPLPVYVYAAVFILLGVSYSGVMIGFTNYLLEIVRESERPSYYGMLNFLSASTMFLPLFGGLVIGAASFPAALLLGSVLLAAGFGLSLGLAEPRLTTTLKQSSRAGSCN